MILQIITMLFLLILSLIMLWFSGDLSVKYSIQTASKFKLTALFVGFVLIAVATGLPELSIVIVSLFEDVPSIPAGTILGSNICNISLSLGAAILLSGRSIKVNHKERKDSLLMLLVTSVAMAIIFLMGVLNKLAGFILMLVYFISIWWLWKNSTKKEIAEEVSEQEEIVKNQDYFLKTKRGVLLKLFGSVILVLISSGFAVRVAINLTKFLNFSLETIGATILAIGATLPEISLGLNALKKKEYALALGNSVGSVLEQGTLILGLLALTTPNPLDIRSLRTLAPFMFLSFGIIAFGIIKNGKIGKVAATLMVVNFIVFLIYQLAWIG